MNDSDRLLAEGTPLVLANGATVRLRYTMRSLKVIEDAHGSLDAIDEVLKAHPIGGLSSVLAAGLLHEGIDADALLDLLDPRSIEDYANAVGVALEQALPAPDDASVGKADAGSGSNGTTFTTLPPSVTAGTMSGSGR